MEHPRASTAQASDLPPTHRLAWLQSTCIRHPTCLVPIHLHPLTCPCAPPHLPAAAYSVKTILQSIQSLLADPNVDSPLNVHAAKLWGVNDAEYRALVTKTYNQPRAS